MAKRHDHGNAAAYDYEPEVEVFPATTAEFARQLFHVDTSSDDDDVVENLHSEQTGDDDEMKYCDSELDAAAKYYGRHVWAARIVEAVPFLLPTIY